MNSSGYSRMSKKLWLALTIVAVLLAITIYRHVQEDRDSEQVALATLDSLKAAHAAQAKAAKLDSIRKDSIRQLVAQNARRDTIIARSTHVSDSLRKQLAEAPKPALADSVNPAWMHRSLKQDTVIAADSVTIREQSFKLANDSAQIHLYKLMHVSDSSQVVSAFRIADSLAVSIKRTVKKSECSFMHPTNCLKPWQYFVAGAVSGAVLHHLATSRYTLLQQK
jgi:hypothetical protein